MKDWQSQAHVKWECKYHVVIVPKYRKKVMYKNLRHEVGKIMQQLCRQKGIELYRRACYVGSCSFAIERASEV